jgi:colanic acid biosynthesis glycosyl transferase WcaI
MEKRAYREADKITFHSEGGRKFLIEKKGVPEEKITTIHNWVEIEPYHNLAGDLSFRKQYGLDDKFIILFAGIMGPAQGLEFIVDIAKKVSDIKDIVFLFVGDGMEEEKIEEKIKEYGLKNIIIKPFVSKEDYYYLVRDADVGLVCLSAKNKTPFVPGKFLGYMAAGKPVLAFLNKESDGFELVKGAKCGYATVSGNLEEAVLLVRKMFQEKNDLNQIGKSGLDYARKNLEAGVIIEKIEKLLSNGH